MLNATEVKKTEQFRTVIEKIMMQLPSESPESHPMYLAGYIDSLYDMGHISENTRENLYSEYSS